MANLPKPTDLAQSMIDSVTTDLGTTHRPGDFKVWDAFYSMFTQLGVRVNQVAVNAFDAVILDRATGNDLDAYCRSRGPVRRHPSAKAIGGLTLARPTFAAGSGTIVAGTEVRAPYLGKSYIFTTDQDISFASTDLTKNANVIAQLAGADSNIGQISAGLTLTGRPGTPFDATIKPTALSVAKGADVETDAEMRERQRLWEQARQRATKPAVAYGALTVNGVKHVVVGDYDDTFLGARSRAYVADVNWGWTQQVLDQVTIALEGWRGLGAVASVGGINQTDVTVTGTIIMARPVAYYNVTTIKTAAALAVQNYFNNRVDPYAYDLAMLSGRIARVHDEISSVNLTSPSSSVQSPLSPTQLLLSGGLPETLTKYRVQLYNINLDVVGPT